MSLITMEANEDVNPICPHCERKLATLCYRRLRSALGRRYVYFCAACHKVLGISHRKGFWMG